MSNLFFCFQSLENFFFISLNSFFFKECFCLKKNNMIYNCSECIYLFLSLSLWVRILSRGSGHLDRQTYGSFAVCNNNFSCEKQCNVKLWHFNWTCIIYVLAQRSSTSYFSGTLITVLLAFFVYPHQNEYLLFILVPFFEHREKEKFGIEW